MLYSGFLAFLYVAKVLATLGFGSTLVLVIQRCGIGLNTNSKGRGRISMQCSYEQ